MKLELHGMGRTLTANVFDPLANQTIKTNVSPFVAPTVVTPIAPPKVTLVDKVTNTINTVNNAAQQIITTGQQIKQVLNPNQIPQGMTAQQYQAYLNQQAQAEKEDNTMLYVALAGGGLLLAGVAVALVKKKKKRGIGRVRKAKAMGKVTRKPAKRTRAKSRKRKTSKRRR
jgi:LPXTG-motif cell wall-anchored protein